MDNLIPIKFASGEKIADGYFASKDGKIYSNKGKIKEIGSINGQGYYTIRIKMDKGNYRTFKRSRIIFETIIGKIPEGLFLNHIDHIKVNDNINNLELANYKINLIRKKNLCSDSNKKRVIHLIDFYKKEIERLEKSII